MDVTFIEKIDHNLYIKVTSSLRCFQQILRILLTSAQKHVSLVDGVIQVSASLIEDDGQTRVAVNIFDNGPEIHLTDDSDDSRQVSFDFCKTLAIQNFGDVIHQEDHRNGASITFWLPVTTNPPNVTEADVVLTSAREVNQV